MTRVLLCDDFSQIRELLRIVLELEGNEVVSEAGNGREAVEEAERLQPDVVLLDLSMPVMDGPRPCPRSGGSPSRRGSSSSRGSTTTACVAEPLWAPITKVQGR